MSASRIELDGRQNYEIPCIFPSNRSTVTPSGRRSSPITSACFEARAGCGSGRASSADHKRSTSASRLPTLLSRSTCRREVFGQGVQEGHSANLSERA